MGVNKKLKAPLIMHIQNYVFKNNVAIRTQFCKLRQFLQSEFMSVSAPKFADKYEKLLTTLRGNVALTEWDQLGNKSSGRLELFVSSCLHKREVWPLILKNCSSILKPFLQSNHRERK